MVDVHERIGQSIGDYRLLRLLVKGTFGTVYLAEHFHDHSSAAVKVLHVPLTGHYAGTCFSMRHARYACVIRILFLSLTLG